MERVGSGGKGTDEARATPVHTDASTGAPTPARAAHFAFSRSSSYGADVAMLVMSPIAGSATRGPNAPMPACYHSGAYMTFS